MPERKIPHYCQHKSKTANRAFVVLNGKRIYLGSYDTPQSREAYHRLIAEWLANGCMLPVEPQDITIVEVCAHFWKHAKNYYKRPDGTSTNELNNFRQALRPLKELYSQTPAAQFGPRALKAVRQRMLDKGWARTTINKQIGRIKRVFKWAAENEIAPSEVFQSLVVVSGLKYGRTEAPETSGVKPVSDAMIAETLPHLTPMLQAMVTLVRQRYKNSRFFAFSVFFLLAYDASLRT